LPSENLAESMARLFTRYKEDRSEGETFQEFCLRHSNEELAQFLAQPSIAASDIFAREEGRLQCMDAVNDSGG
jgi:hypothetical protein